MKQQTPAMRLNSLADFLDTLPADALFRYESIMAGPLGWAAQMPEFRRLGLGCIEDNAGKIHVVLWDQPPSVESSLVAASEIFGLRNDEAAFLFQPGRRCVMCAWESPGKGATAGVVATHIRRFVKAKEGLE